MTTLLYPVINYVMVNTVESMIKLKRNNSSMNSDNNNIMIKPSVIIKNSEIDEFQTPWSTFNDMIHTDTEFNSDDDDLYTPNTAAAVENIKVKVGSDGVSVRNITVQAQLLKVVNYYKRHIVSLVGIFLTIAINTFVPLRLWTQVYSVLLTATILFICYMMPCIMYLKLEADWRHPKSIGALVIIFVNVVVMIGGITVIMMHPAS